MKGRKGLRLAFYLRVSRSDEREGESNSIANQRAFLRAYADRHLGGREHVEYIDDGYSGANFDRPEVTRLMADCRKGIVDTILVKDLSRFGRNYVDVGDYVEQVLPRLGVRFISVLDRVNIEETGGLDLETAREGHPVVPAGIEQGPDVQGMAGQCLQYGVQVFGRAQGLQLRADLPVPGEEVAGGIDAPFRSVSGKVREADLFRGRDAPFPTVLPEDPYEHRRGY